MNTQGMIPLKENDSKKISDRYQKKTYAKGATCIYGDTLYRAKADITTAEEWTAAHWEETNMETIRAEMAAEVSALNANKASYTVIQKTSETLTLYNGATGDYQAMIDFSVEVAQLTDSQDYKLIPLGCYQITDNNRVGVLSRIFIDNKAVFRINAGCPSQFNCVMLLIY